jgi:hypothetical protein
VLLDLPERFPTSEHCPRSEVSEWQVRLSRLVRAVVRHFAMRPELAAADARLCRNIRSIGGWMTALNKVSA